MTSTGSDFLRKVSTYLKTEVDQANAKKLNSKKKKLLFHPDKSPLQCNKIINADVKEDDTKKKCDKKEICVVDKVLNELFKSDLNTSVLSVDNIKKTSSECNKPKTPTLKVKTSSPVQLPPEFAPREPQKYAHKDKTKSPESGPYASTDKTTYSDKEMLNAFIALDRFLRNFSKRTKLTGLLYLFMHDGKFDFNHLMSNIKNLSDKSSGRSFHVFKPLQLLDGCSQYEFEDYYNTYYKSRVEQM
jgi:hypothetical protein